MTLATYRNKIFFFKKKGGIAMYIVNTLGNIENFLCSCCSSSAVLDAGADTDLLASQPANQLASVSAS